MRRSRKFCQRGGGGGCFFCWWEMGGSKYHYKRAIIGPPAKPHFNGVSLACQWWPNIECWLGSFVIFQGIWTKLLRNPIFLWFFRRGPDPRSPLWIRPWKYLRIKLLIYSYQNHDQLYRPFFSCIAYPNFLQILDISWFLTHCAPLRLLTFTTVEGSLHSSNPVGLELAIDPPPPPPPQGEFCTLWFSETTLYKRHRIKDVSPLRVAALMCNSTLYTLPPKIALNIPDNVSTMTC